MIVNRRSLGRAIGIVCLCLGFSRPVLAQNDRAPMGERGTELGASVGAGSTSTHTGPMLGGIASWQLKSWITGEARGTWLARGTGANAFEADLGLSAHLVRRSRATPYVGAGFGLYRAAFDSASSTMSAFYRRRLVTGGLGLAMDRAFTDPVFRVSGGVEMFTRGPFTIRPEVSALFVRRDGRGDTVGLFAVRIGYRFFDRPVTP